MKAEVLPLKITEKLTDLVNKYWLDIWKSKKEGGLVAWCSGMSPLEILRAMDINVFYPEAYGGFCGVAGRSTELCQRAEALGYSQDLCSVVRNFIGATYGTDSVEQDRLLYGGLPKPDLLFCESYCPGVYKMWEKYSLLFNVPLWVMERPRMHDAQSKEQVAYYVREGIKELKEMISFLERFTGRRFDIDRLSQSLVLERKANRLWWDSVELCRNIPAPMSVFDAVSHIFPYYLCRGEPQAVTYNQELKSELLDRVAQKISPMVAEEKYRLYWDNLPIFFKLEEHIKKFASYGAVPVVAMNSFIYGFPEDIEPEKPLESIIKLSLFVPGNRGLKGRIEFFTKLVEDYSVVGLVMQRSRTCLLNNMGQDDVMKAMTEKTGLPAVVIEGDVCDTRFYSDSEFNQKIDAFMEILEKRGLRRE